jgi:hypothetical protein
LGNDASALIHASNSAFEPMASIRNAATHGVARWRFASASRAGRQTAFDQIPRRAFAAAK